MRIVVAGGTGFLGTPLVEAFARRGHTIVVLTRRPAHAPAWAYAAEPGRVFVVAWSPDGSTGPWASALEGADAVVNLAGESMAVGRWSPARKARLRDSRLLPTRSLVAAILGATRPPSVLVSQSAVGYYGLHGDEVLTEESPAGSDFVATLCVDWEREARAAAPAARVVPLRTGVVLAADGGALERMLLPFRLFAGGAIGSGRQYMSWIHRADWIALTRCAVENPIDGAVNATSPNPVTNREFAAALGRALGRPAVLRAPGFAMRLAFGEMAEAMLLGGQRVIPARAIDQGFEFRHPEIGPALAAVIKARR
jgi:uncharacterized protein (TIGR01777 family)